MVSMNRGQDIKTQENLRETKTADRCEKYAREGFYILVLAET